MIRFAWQRWSKPRYYVQLIFGGSLPRLSWGHCMPRLNINKKGTACIESSPVILHDQPRDAIFKWLVKLAETSDDKIDDIVDVGIGFLFIIDGIDIFISMFLANSIQIVDRIIKYLHDFFGDELFLR